VTDTLRKIAEVADAALGQTGADLMRFALEEIRAYARTSPEAVYGRANQEGREPVRSAMLIGVACTPIMVETRRGTFENAYAHDATFRVTSDSPAETPFTHEDVSRIFQLRFVPEPVETEAILTDARAVRRDVTLLGDGTRLHLPCVQVMLEMPVGNLRYEDFETGRSYLVRPKPEPEE
jgi:hypothetical protein